jgi:signal transduction histidine kinase
MLSIIESGINVIIKKFSQPKYYQGCAFVTLTSSCQVRKFTENSQIIAQDSTLKADSTRLMQIMWNIIGNAIKFSVQNSELKISTYNQDK